MTSQNTQERSIGRFTPASVADFTERARNVSRFLGMGRRTAEERLARLYGYATAHDIRIAITQAIAAGDEPGPYDSECSNHIFGKPQRLHSMASVDRGSACLAMAREAFGETLRVGERVNGMSAGMSHRTWAFREIGLFSEMGIHRRLMREHSIAQDAIDVIEGREPPAADATIRPPQDYATLEVNRWNGCQLAFTDLGEGLADAIAHAMNPETTPDYHDRDARLTILQRLHPQNPYIHAARCVNDCYAIYNGRPHPRRHIPKAIEHYDRAVILFDQLYAAMPEGTKHARTSSRSYMTSHEMDSSGMRVMCEHLMNVLRKEKVAGRIRELTRRLSFFNVGRDGRDRMAT